MSSRLDLGAEKVGIGGAAVDMTADPCVDEGVVTMVWSPTFWALQGLILWASFSLHLKDARGDGLDACRCLDGGELGLAQQRFVPPAWQRGLHGILASTCSGGKGAWEVS